MPQEDAAESATDTVDVTGEPEAPDDSAGDIAYPKPTGDHLVGVRHFEFVDTHYPVRRQADVDGRRLTVRVWYPAAEKHGERRPYFKGLEKDVYAGGVVNALGAFLPGITTIYRLAEIETSSYENAPVANDLDDLPVLVFSPGGLAYVSQNTAIMEELASHGYLIFSVGNPGGSGGVLYPNGDHVPFDTEWRDAIFSLPPLKPDATVAERHKHRESMLDTGGLGPWAPRWRDDMLALVDLLEDKTADTGIEDIVDRANLEKLAYFGMSYGASAAVSAAQADPRAKVAVNFDGTHHLSDVFGENVRVPLLVLTSETTGDYSNEFFFEPFDSMGERKDIVRVGLPGVSHLELMDNMFLPATDRAELPGAGAVDGTVLHQTLAGFMLAFFDNHLKGIENGYPEALFEKFPNTQQLDVSHIKAWTIVG